MDEQDKNIIQYLIPANVSTKFEFFDGFGWYELKIVSVCFIIGILLFFALGIPKKTIYTNVDNVSIEATIGIDTEDVETVEKKVPYIPSIVRVLLIIIPTVGSFFFVKKDPSNGLSLMYTVKSAKDYKRKQKLYLYKYNSGLEE